jgi:peptide/nickel transport system permease protein
MHTLTLAFQRLRRLGPVRIALICVGLLAIIAAVRPELLTSENPQQIDVDAILKGPSWHHWLGTDEEGTDVLTRIIYGTRLDLLIAVGSAAIAAVIGVPAGLLAGYSGKAIDQALQSVAVGTLAFPLILFAVLIVASFGASLATLVFILGFLFVPQVFLVTRAQSKAIREREYITSAVVIGVRTRRILRRHVFPNVIGPVLVLVPQLMATAIIAEAGLSYLGLGLQPPSITWGTVLLASKDYYQQQPAYAAAGGLMVTIAAALLILAGDVISESVDPRRRRLTNRNFAHPKVIVPVAPQQLADGAADIENDAAEAVPVGAVNSAMPPAVGAWVPGSRGQGAEDRGAQGQNDAELVAGGGRASTQEQSAASPLLEVRELSVAYSPRGGMSKTVSDVKAVDGVSFALAKGECLGLVGESGSGKSSIARALVRVAPATGQFLFKGVDFFQLQGEPLRAARREVQLIAQNPRGSIDPRQSAGEVVREPLEVHRLLPRREIGAQVDTLMHQVGFDPALADRRPHQLSGGQCQRLAIARSLAVRAELLICDEPTSALDVSVQAQIINLLKDIQAVDQTSFLFISHDLAVVRQLAHNVAVLYRGRIVELAPAARLFAAPAHPYTVELLSSVAPGHAHTQDGRTTDGEHKRPSLPVAAAQPTQGCAFAPRCPYADAICLREAPNPEITESGHTVECHHWRVLTDGTVNVGA